jgi:hypothetical protein
MKAKFSTEASFDIKHNTYRYIIESGTLHEHRCENLSFNIQICSAGKNADLNIKEGHSQGDFYVLGSKVGLYHVFSFLCVYG